MYLFILNLGVTLKGRAYFVYLDLHPYHHKTKNKRFLSLITVSGHCPYVVYRQSRILYQQVCISYQMESYPWERINRGDNTSMKRPFSKEKKNSPGKPKFEKIRTSHWHLSLTHLSPASPLQKLN